jgi:serine/threonine protein kinase
MNEIAAMQTLSAHPNVLSCTEVLFDGEYLHVIMPFISRGDLHDRMEFIKKTNPMNPLGGFRGLSENEAHFYFCQLLNGVRHLQAHGMSYVLFHD